MPTQRIGYIDAIRGLTMLLVVYCHVEYYSYNISFVHTIFGMLFVHFRMPMFFFISGFIVYKSVDIDWQRYLKVMRKKAVVQIIPTLFFFHLFYVVCQNKPIGMFIDKGPSGYWFTIVLFECFLVYYLLTIAVKNEKWRIGILLLLSLAGIGMLAVNKDFGPAIFGLRRLTKFFQFFVLGALAMKYRPKYEWLMNNEMFKATFILMSFIVLFLLTYNMPTALHHFLRDVALRYFTTFAIVSFFFCHENSLLRESRVNSLVSYIGQNSLAIYLIHYFFLPQFRPVPKLFDGADMVTVHLVSMLYTVAITVLCLVFIKFLSHSKYIRKWVLGKK